MLFLEHINVLVFPNESHFRKKFISIVECFEEVSLFWFQLSVLAYLALTRITTTILRRVRSVGVCSCVVDVVGLRYLKVVAASASVINAVHGLCLIGIIYPKIIVSLPSCNAATGKTPQCLVGLVIRCLSINNRR